MYQSICMREKKLILIKLITLALLKKKKKIIYLILKKYTKYLYNMLYIKCQTY